MAGQHYDGAGPCENFEENVSVVHAGNHYSFRLDDRINKTNLIRGDVQSACGGSKRPVTARVVANTDMPEFLQKEGTVLHVLHNKPHRCFPKMRTTIESAGANFVVMDRLDIDLGTYIRSRGWIPETEAMPLFRQLVSAVAHCHDNRIVLRRLRLEHIFLSDESRSNLVVADLGGAEAVRIPASSSSMADRGASDVQGLGRILFSMLTGRNYREFRVFRQKGQRSRAFQDLPQPLSDQARQLLRQLLNRDPTTRPAANTVLENPLVQSSLTTTFKMAAADEETPSARLQSLSPTSSTCSSRRGSISAEMDCDQMVPEMTCSSSPRITVKRKRVVPEPSCSGYSSSSSSSSFSVSVTQRPTTLLSKRQRRGSHHSDYLLKCLHLLEELKQSCRSPIYTPDQTKKQPTQQFVFPEPSTEITL